MTQVGTCTLAKREIIHEIGFLGRHKATGPGGLSPPSVKDDSKSLTAELTKLLRSTGQLNIIPMMDLDQWLYQFIRNIISPWMKTTVKLVP